MKTSLFSSSLPLIGGSDGSGVQLNPLLLLDVMPRGTMKPERAAGLHKTAPSIDGKS